MSARRSIGDYAVVGDTHTIALIARDGSIEWWCLPRFDAPAVFVRLLDDDRGGAFSVRPANGGAVAREYLAGTNVLETTFSTDGGVTTLRDWMPWRGSDESTAARAIVRDIHVVSGRCSAEVVFDPTFDYARAAARFDRFDRGVVAHTSDSALALFAPDLSLTVGHSGVRGTAELRAGDQRRFVAGFGDRPEEAIAAARAIYGEPVDATIDAWRSWSNRCCYDGPYRAAVLRSALTLKMLTFAPTGALVAAPTTSLPEDLGGVRNWDYRYAWLRDASLAVYALMGLGYHDESLRFFNWIERLGHEWERGAPIRIMYTLDGTAVPCETTLEHLRGFADSRPVRIGNDAHEQIQLDIVGEVLHAAHTCYCAMGWDRPQLLRALGHLVDYAADNWRKPDAGLWEMRGPPAHHLNSKLLCWVALDRGVRLARATGLRADTARWQHEADTIRAVIVEKGYSREVGAFTQTLGGSALDASALRIPLTRLLPVTDPRVQSTIARIEHDLTRSGLVLRYRTVDALPGTEATFALCSLWMANVRARMADVEDARGYLDRVLSAANDVGLLSEEIDAATGELLGNFPQAFTHLGVIDAALAIAEATAAR